MKNLLTVFAVVGLMFSANAQVTWAEEAAEVFYDNCTVCHHNGGIAPNSLMTYAECYNYGPLISAYVSGGIMPPWTADTGYVHFSQERILTQAEKNTILDWVNDGMLEGDPAQAPPQPVYQAGQMLPGTPDLVVSAPNYMSKATAQADDYVCFAIPSGLTETRRVKAIEVIPGNPEIVHHCLVYNDNTGFASTDTSGNCAGPITSSLMGGYTPGATPIIFPSTSAFQAGMTMPAGTDIVLAMHYPAGSYGMWDETKVNFYFYPEPVNNFREVSCDPLIEDWTFSIPGGTFDSTYVTTSPIGADYTVMSVFPHMHLLGHYIQSYAVTGANDTIPMVKIPEWDFDWQDFYWFQHMLKVPNGSTLHGKGVWNNTVTNPHNPNNPPITVGPGLNTTDEMFLIYYHYMLYQNGDEDIDIDSLTNEYLSFDEEFVGPAEINAYPNPFADHTAIAYNLQNASYVNLYIYDMQGRVIKRLFKGKQNSGAQKVIWDGTNTKGAPVQSGIYFYSIRIDGLNYSGKIFKQ